MSSEASSIMSKQIHLLCFLGMPKGLLERCSVYHNQYREKDQTTASQGENQENLFVQPPAVLIQTQIIY